MSKTKPLVIAHRGAAGEAPENTLASFKLALEQGCDGFELDVHLSKDGQIVVIHDPTIKRTTNGQGAVASLTLEELRQVDAGSWYGEAFTGERIPTLEEVFDLAPSDLLINVEIKGGIGEGMEEALIELMRRKNRVESVVVSSFDFKTLAALKRLEPAVRVGLLYNNRLSHHWKLPEAAGVETYSLHMHLRGLDAEDARDAQEHGYALYPWTVNEEEKMRQAVSYGVDAIITDYPGRLRTILEEQG
ncbi:glycerophosphodiester phosphodiesterase [Paenibacillus aurantius]|uniref:Glycerophosphodiester phosphodiesterase n=1 Tax=Paenibacillus aurantius TaxID=2918900 RepID=A0AA96LDT7_9BACL|nr:glycerophosphodiester phosphodiesterase [Paenibacillus aurantius]WNQ10261.1 glycerophosphodiester phosphodiesterase [Paenibacillus aurantius]